MPSRLQMEAHLTELDGLLAVTSRPPLRERLQTCQRHVQDALTPRQASLERPANGHSQDPSQVALPLDPSPQGSSPPAENVDANPPSQYETIDPSEWAQSSKFVKLYLTVAGLTEAHQDRVTCTFTTTSLHLTIMDVNGTNWRLVQEPLTNKIKPNESRFKLQDGSLVLFLAKVQPLIRWGAVSPRQAALPDHFGRTELKGLLNEYHRIRGSDVYRASEYPLAASISKFMTSQGYYDIFDVASANTALVGFTKRPPKAALVNFTSVEMTRATKKLLGKLITAVAGTPGCKLMFTCPSFIKPDRHPIYNHYLDIINRGSCELVHFSGRISCPALQRLPATLYKLGVGIANTEDCALVADMTLPKKLQTLGVSVARNVTPKQLKPLPKVKYPVHIFFNALSTSNDVEWAAQCANKLMGLRTFWLHFPNCRLQADEMKMLVESFFYRSCPIHFQYQLFTQLVNQGFPKQLLPAQFQKPPTMLAAPMLGIPPFLPKPQACGLLGTAFESPHLSKKEKQDVQKTTRILGCQSRWTVDWTDAE